MSGDKISIIVPIYNTEQYLGKCVSSIQAQTYDNIEIILVDDGSIDLSGVICDDFANADSRIKVVHKENGGLSSARKAGIAKATGKYIGFVDSDDWIDPGMYEHLVSVVKKNRSELTVLQRFYSEKEKDVCIVSSALGEECYDTGEKMKYLRRNLLIGEAYECTPIYEVTWNTLWERNILEYCYDTIPNHVQPAEDTILWIACAMKATSVSLTDGCYYHYRKRTGSIMNSTRKNALSNSEFVYRYLHDLFGTSDDREALIRRLDLWIVRLLINQINSNMGLMQGISIPIYILPQELIGQGERIVIYGAGDVGQSYRKQMLDSSNVFLVAWLDGNAEKYRQQGMDVQEPENIRNVEYDKVIVAVMKVAIADEIIEYLIEIGVKRERIYWSEPKTIFEYCLPYKKYVGEEAVQKV